MKNLRLLFIRTISLGAILIATVMPGVAHAERIIIHAGKLIDGIADKAFSERSIVIEGNIITAIEQGYIKPAKDDKLIDLREHTVMPGLMDMHTHLSLQYGKNTYIERFTLNTADRAYHSVGYAERTLMAGFTTVRDLGELSPVTVALRKSIEQGRVKGPRVYTAGKSIATTGGHADPTNGWRDSIKGDPGPAEGVINGVADARKAVRQRYKDGANLIKITATGGVLSLASSGDNAQFSDDELAAIVSTAKDYGFTVAVHAHGAEGMKRAIRAGVDSIEHGTYMDEETMRLMKKHGTWYVPTVIAGKWVEEKAAVPGFFPDVVRPKAAAIGPLIQNTFAKAYKAGVKIAFGTDSGVSAHGDNAREFMYMVEAGMPPMEAIKSATMNGAKLLRIDDKLGSLSKGKLADVVAVKGDPLNDVKILQDMAFVMKDGHIYKH